MAKPLEAYISPEPNSGCWLWDQNPTHDGYGRATVNGKRIYAHRAVYEQHKGPISKDLTLDHLCRVRSCVNPAHLEPVPLNENIARGNYGWRKDLTECKHGHKFTPENTIWKSATTRNCRACGVIASRNYRRKIACESV